jgi:hypothetical protein
MSAVLLAVFSEYKVAERVRVELVRDGFPTDRVELTAGCEMGRADLAPADSPYGRLIQYFRVLFTFQDERHYAEQLAERVDNGDAIITVHPRGSREIARATQILWHGDAVQLLSHDIVNQPPLFAVTKRARPWILGGLVLGLLPAGYLVAKQEFSEVGLRLTPSELQLEQTHDAVPDETDLLHTGCMPSLPSRSLNTVIAHYFDTYSGPG